MGIIKSKNKKIDQEEFTHYVGLDDVYDFFTKYVQRVYLDVVWKRNMNNNPNLVWFQLLMPSNIAWVILLIKNSKAIWDQKKNLQKLDSNEVLARKKPLFTAGEGTKRVFGQSTWNKEGLQYFYTAETNWKEVYKSKEQMSVLVNGWERWEPEDDKTRKNLLRRMRWRGREDSPTTNEDEKGWWENDDGYSSEDMLGTEDVDFEMDNDNLQKIKKIFRGKKNDEDSYEEDEEEEKENEGREENEKEDEEGEVTITKDHRPVAVSKVQRVRRSVGKYKD